MASHHNAPEQTQASALFNLMAARIPGIVWSTDANLRMTSVFVGLAAIGVPPDNLVGKTLFEIAQTDDEEFPAVVAHRRALRGESVDYDRRWKGHTYRSHVQRLTDQSGAVIGCIGFAHDVTEQARAESALQKAHDELEQRVAARTAELTAANEQLKRAKEELTIFHRFAEAAGQGFGMGDLDGRIAYVNPAMCRLVGEEKPEDMIGKRFWAYYPEGWAERRAKEVLPALERNGYWDAEQDVLSRQGKRIPTLHHVFLVRDDNGTPVRRAFVATDITERKQAAKALRGEAKYRHLVEATDTGYLILDDSGRVVDANDEYVRISGHHTLEAILGQSVVEWTAPYDVDRNAKKVEECVEGGTCENSKSTMFTPMAASLLSKSTQVALRPNKAHGFFHSVEIFPKDGRHTKPWCGNDGR